MNESKYDLVVIGAGPGGYVGAIRAAQLGMKVACIDENPQLGGTCLRVGCIPSKALLDSSEKLHAAKKEFESHGIGLGGVSLTLDVMMERKRKIVDQLTKGVGFLFKKNKIKRFEGRGRIVAPGKVAVEGKDEAQIEASKILIATGSAPATIPGVELDGDRIGSSTEALSYPRVPEHLIVIGAGVIGLELGSVWSRLGSKVTVVEYLDRILPEMDADVAKQAHRLFKRQGLDIKLKSKVLGARVEGEKCTVELEGAAPLTADRVLVAVGRKPYTEGLGLEDVGIKVNEKGRVIVSESYETSVGGIYAIGDVIGGAMLAHKASDEGVACVEKMTGGLGHMNYDAVPSIVYTEPEVACVGKTEEQLKEAEIPYRKGSFSFKANGRALAMGHADGVVKILAHEETDRILGAHICGPRAGDLIAEVAVAIEYGASSEDLARACHAHPTLSEAVKEAALAVDARAIHA